MKIAPLTESDPLVDRALRSGEVHAVGMKAVPVESSVEIELVELLHEGPELNYRPYLHLRGELTNVEPSVELPYGITELALRRGNGIQVDAFYEFAPHQLSELVAKGYFTEAFRVPDGLTGIPWQLPAEADFVVIGPDVDTEPPIVLMQVNGSASLQLDQATSGYDLSSYFPDYTAEQQVERVQEGQYSTRERVTDMFADVELDERTAEDRPRSRREAESQALPDSAFDRLVAEVSVTDAPEVETSHDVQHEEGSAEDTYARSIAPSLAEALNGAEAAPEAEAPVADPESKQEEQAPEDTPEALSAEELLLEDEDEDLSPRPMASERPGADSHRRAARDRRQRAERLREDLLVDAEAETPTDDVQLG